MRTCATCGVTKHLVHYNRYLTEDHKTCRACWSKFSKVRNDFGHPEPCKECGAIGRLQAPDYAAGEGWLCRTHRPKRGAMKTAVKELV